MEGGVASRPTRRTVSALGAAGCIGLLVAVLVVHSGQVSGPTELAKAGWGEYLFSRFSGEPAERSEAIADRQERTVTAQKRRAHNNPATATNASPITKKVLLRKLKEVLSEKQQGIHIETAEHSSDAVRDEQQPQRSSISRSPIRRAYRHLPGKAFAANPAWRKLVTANGEPYPNLLAR
jgi:hypothetical protein